MEYRALGQSGLQLPVIGFGSAHTGVLMVGDDEDLQNETVRLALESGIDYFDTAAKYGNGRSESNLGRVLRILGATPQISTKVALTLDDLDDPHAAVLRDFEQNLDRLGVDHVAALMLHNRVYENPEIGGLTAGDAQLSLDHIFAKNGIAAAFQELQSAGKVKAIGFTANGGDPNAITEMIKSSVFGALNSDFSLINPSTMVKVSDQFELRDYKGVIDQAAAAGMGVMAIKVLATGGLTSSVAREGREKLIVEAAAQIDDSLVRVAIRYVLSKPGISTVIIGFSQPSHVTDAVEALAQGPLDGASIASLEKAALA